MEIGSFIEMEFPKGREYYSGLNVARLNSGRSGIYHALRLYGCNTVYLPHYQCETVREFLIRNHIKVNYYSIDREFNLLIESIPSDAAIVIVNYYGIMSETRLKTLIAQFHNVIIDNSQAFFSKPLQDCFNVYSARKFVGVPDGAYVIGNNACKYLKDYQQDYSSDTSLFLLQRIEYGCEKKSYESRQINELRIDQSDIKRMSQLTKVILDGTNYENIKHKRIENFKYAHILFNNINKLNPLMYYEDDCTPMVYPLIIENDNIINKLLEAKHFQGRWWSYLLGEVMSSSFEYYLSRYMIPITVDQRYGKCELDFIANIIKC